MDAAGPYRAARDLLLRRSPRLAGGGSTLLQAGESTVEAAKRIAGLLNDSVLAIQGPPGAGKTFAGARMICELIRQGKKVGITAVSHKVIRNLLDEVVSAAQESGIAGLRCIQKVSEKPEENASRHHLRHRQCGAACSTPLRRSGGCGYSLAVVARGLFRGGRRTFRR